MAFQTQIYDFLDMMAAETGASENTLSAYESDLKQFETWCAEKRPDVLTADDIAAYIQELGRRNYAPKSVARKLSALKDFFRFLFIEREIPRNPAADILAPKQEKTLPKFLTADETARLIAAAEEDKSSEGLRMTVMLTLMYACGLRVSELVSLPENCINFDKKHILVRGKGNKERLVPVADKALKAVASYLPRREEYIRGRKSIWLFPSKKSKLGHLTRNAFFKHLKTLAVKAGISPEKVSPHVMRHSFATHLLQHDVDLRSIQQMLGHSEIGTTEIYTHILSEDTARKVFANHPLASRKK